MNRTLILLLAGCLLSACAAPGEKSTPEVVAVTRASVPATPDDAAWREAPFHTAALLLQDMVEPRLLEPSTPHVDVRAITDGSRIAFKLTWADATANDLPGAGRFSDACAVQLPVGESPDVPAPQMGEDGRTVEIAYWKASWQAVLDGRPDTIQATYPGASVDHYPFEAASLEAGSDRQRGLERQFAPARALDNPMEGPRDRSVQDLLAAGPGTLTPTRTQHSEGSARRTPDGWEVVIVRPLPDGLDAGRRTQVALAVWDGEQDEVGARKMRSGWIPLHVEDAG
jgi:DMSO reductase family type II enzyme heme b subunit